MASKRRPLRWCLRWGAVLVAAASAWTLLSLVLLRYVDPPTTGVHMQRRVESWFAKDKDKEKYVKRYEFVPLSRISPAFQHAVIAAEDGNFYWHHGFDWVQIKDAVEDAEAGHPRGASTISQQLVKNLFFTTHGNPLRKVAEFAIVPVMERVLDKQRILELYLNVVEWGPGVFGAEEAAKVHFGTTAAKINREQGARLAAVLPAPRRRKPARMDRYSNIILGRMTAVGW